MATLTKPVVLFPAYEISQEEMIDFLRPLAPESMDWSIVERMIRNTTVSRKRLVLPLQEIVQHRGFEKRNDIYIREACKMGIPAVQQALDNATLHAHDIDMIIITSCTGFMMPAFSAYLISNMDFKHTTKHLPIAQLGCVAGNSAINRAFEYTTIFPSSNVLIVSIEFPSLCFQPTDHEISSFVSDAIFGDSVAACVVKGKGKEGYQLIANISYTLKNTERYIAYDVKDTGFHFVLDKAVIAAIGQVAPVIHDFVSESIQSKVTDLDFFVFHTGGKRILDELVLHLGISEKNIAHSRASLSQHGNIASGVVFDVLLSEFENGDRKNNDKGIIAAFGPGFTAEINTGVWIC